MAIARRHAARWTQVFCRQIRTPSCERLDRLGFTSHVEWLSSSDTYNVARRLEWRGACGVASGSSMRCDQRRSQRTQDHTIIVPTW